MGSVATHQWSRTRSCATLRARRLDAGPRWVLELFGEADIAALSLLEQELAQMARMNREEVVVDVARLAFCDVACAQLVRSVRRTHPVTVVGATGRVKRVFDLLDALQMHKAPGFNGANDSRVGPLLRAPVAV